MSETENSKTESSTETTEVTTETAAATIYQSMAKEDSKTTEDEKSKEDTEDKKSDEDDESDKEDEKSGEGDEESGKDGEKSDEDKKDEKSDEKSDDEKKDKEEDKKAEPYKIELPEDVAADPKMIEGLETFANEHGIPKDKAIAFAKDMVEKQTESIKEVLVNWVEEAKNDKEIGGAKFEENAALARKAVERFGGPQLKSALEETGLGSHPEVIRTFFKIGKAMSDDSMFVDGSEKPSQKNGIETLYPSMVKT